MSKILIYSLSVITIPSVIILVFFWLRGDTHPSPETNSQDALSNEAEVIEPKEQVGRSSLAELLARNENLECTFVHETEAVVTERVEGTYFTSRGRLRADLFQPSETPPQLTSMIMRDNWLYVWTEIEGERYGMKMNWLDLAQVEASDGAPQANTGVPLYQPVDYRCVPWPQVDGSIFEPPSDILFTDYAAAVSSGMEFGTVYEGEGSVPPTNPCDICLQVSPGPGRDECINRFQCSSN